MDQLRKQVESLEAKVQKLEAVCQRLEQVHAFFTVEAPEKPGEQPTLSLQCSILTLVNPKPPGEPQGYLAASATGPCLSFRGSDGRARVILTAEKDEPQASFYGAGGKQGVRIDVDETSGAGQVAVLEAGQPRALMKGQDDNGIISVVHDDGHARAFIRSSKLEGAEIGALTPDMKVGVKLTSGLAQGGFIAVNRPNGKPAVAVFATDDGGVVWVNDAKGRLAAILPVPPLPPPDETSGPEPEPPAEPD